MRSSCRLRWRKAVHSRLTVLVPVNIALFAYAFASDSVRSAEPADRTQTIVIENMQFVPAELVVERGNRVRWVNRDLVAHTATADAFDSGTIGPNASWLHVAAKPGVYTYVCALHPTMKARLIVR